MKMRADNILLAALVLPIVGGAIYLVNCPPPAGAGSNSAPSITEDHYTAQTDKLRAELNRGSLGDGRYIAGVGKITGDPERDTAYCQVTVAFWELSRARQQTLERSIAREWGKISGNSEAKVEFSDSEKVNSDTVWARDCSSG